MLPEDLAKRELRRTLRARLRSLEPETRLEASRAATYRLLALPELKAARTVALYAATPEEADPADALRALRERSVRVTFPRVAGPDLEFAPVRDASELQRGHQGILEPASPSIDLTEIDAMMVPGLAFDRQGMRLGRGGGHYDRTLSRLERRVLRIGFCFDFQLMEQIPHGPLDQAVNVIVTECRVIWPHS
jgi:5-formyltetrahydrofolate cyclo-ligase